MLNWLASPRALCLGRARLTTRGLMRRRLLGMRLAGTRLGSPGEAGAGGDDARGLDNLVAGGVERDGEAGPVEVGAGGVAAAASMTVRGATITTRVITGLPNGGAPGDEAGLGGQTSLTGALPLHQTTRLTPDQLASLTRPSGQRSRPSVAEAHESCWCLRTALTCAFMSVASRARCQVQGSES